MKFKKESLLDFFRSLKQGSVLVAETIKKLGEKQEELTRKIISAIEKKQEGTNTEIKLIEPVKLEKPGWIGELKIPITQILEGFAGIIGSISPIRSILERIEKKEWKLPISKDGRILVEVDRVGGGGGSRGSVSSGKQDETLFEYKLARLPVSGDTFLYLGYMNRDGGWYITEIDEESGTQLYAKGSEDFTAAWSSRAGLDYGEFNNVF